MSFAALLVTVAAAVVACRSGSAAAASPATQPNASAASETVAIGRPLRILFIGNSYTFFNEMPRIVRGLALADGPRRAVEIESSVIGGATLKIHWDKGDALRAIQKGGWTHVVLQGYTLPTTDPDAFVKYGQLFDDAIRAAGAKTVLFVNWPTRQDQPQLQGRITESYLKLAQRTGAAVAPVGPAWMAAMKKDPELHLYHTDRTHPNARGSYLAACAIYAAICGHSPEGLAFRRVDERDNPRPLTLESAEATALQAAAWQSILDLRAPATVPAP